MLQHANFKVGQSELINEIKKLNKFVDYAVEEVLIVKCSAIHILKIFKLYLLLWI